jgi:DNA (cytosine-5)-methyltransferase 1
MVKDKVVSPESGINTKFSGKKFKTELFGPDNTHVALISHYLRNGGDKNFRTAAIQNGKKMLEYELGNEISDTAAENALQYLIDFKNEVPFPKPENPTFTFIDLFAGIGGFRLALQNLGGECVFSSEWDKSAQKTYYSNFGEIPFGDITKDENKKWIPEKFDILCGGFPCQPFSIAGVSKKNSLGRKHGFEDEKQGNLFFHVAEIIEKHRPKAFFLENVKNLVSHDKGNTFKVIKQTLLDLGYTFYSKVLDGKHFVPQHRERTIMVGFDTEVFGGTEQFSFPEFPEKKPKFKDIMEDSTESKYTLSTKLWEYLQNYAKKHKEAGNGFGFGLVDFEGVSRTLSARYYKDGSEILIPQSNKNPRRLTPRECARLQGYPENYIIQAADTPAYKQFGNSVVVPLIRSVGQEIVSAFIKIDDDT